MTKSESSSTDAKSNEKAPLLDKGLPEKPPKLLPEGSPPSYSPPAANQVDDLHVPLLCPAAASSLCDIDVEAGRRRPSSSSSRASPRSENAGGSYRWLFRRYLGDNPKKFSFWRALLYITCASFLSALIIFIIAVIYFKPASINAYLLSQKSLEIEQLNIKSSSENNNRLLSDVAASVSFFPNVPVNPRAWPRMQRLVDSALTVQESEYNVFISPESCVQSKFLSYDYQKPVARVKMSDIVPALDPENPIMYISSEQCEITMVDEEFITMFTDMIMKKRKDAGNWRIRFAGTPTTSLGWVNIPLNLDIEMVFTPASILDSLSNSQFKLTGSEFFETSIVNSPFVTLNMNTSFMNPFPLNLDFPASASVPIYEIPEGSESPCTENLPTLAYLLVPESRYLDVRQGFNELKAQLDIPFTKMPRVLTLVRKYHQGKTISIRIGPNGLLRLPDGTDKEVGLCLVHNVTKSGVAALNSGGIIGSIMEAFDQKLHVSEDDTFSDDVTDYMEEDSLESEPGESLLEEEAPSSDEMDDEPEDTDQADGDESSTSDSSETSTNHDSVFGKISDILHSWKHTIQDRLKGASSSLSRLLRGSTGCTGGSLPSTTSSSSDGKNRMTVIELDETRTITKDGTFVEIEVESMTTSPDNPSPKELTKPSLDAIPNLGGIPVIEVDIDESGIGHIQPTRSVAPQVEIVEIAAE